MPVDLIGSVLGRQGWGRSYTLRRRAAGVWTAGRYTPGAAAETTVTAVVQPAGPEDLLDLPEGERVKAVVRVHTTSELRTADESAGTDPDRIVIDGEEWEVRRVWNETHTDVLPYYKALAVRAERA